MPNRATPLLLAVLLAVPAALAAEDPTRQPPAPPPTPSPEGGDPQPSPDPAPAGEEAAPSGKPAVVDENVDVRGNRYRIKLTHGAQIEGVLPAGVKWERLDQFGEYEECKETDKGSGLRLSYVLGMEGDIHILRRDIADIRDLGALTDEEQRAIRDKVIAARRKVIEQREKALREDLRRMAEEQKAADARAGEDDAQRKAKEKAAEEKEIKKGEELLKKFPPDQWSEQRLKDILQREIVNGIFRNAEEREFIDNFKAWQAADTRRRAEEAKSGEGGEKGESGGKEKGAK